MRTALMLSIGCVLLLTCLASTHVLAMDGAAVGDQPTPEPYFVVETATMGPTGQNGGSSVRETQYLGVSFTLPDAVRLTRVGGHFGSFTNAPDYDTIFFAITPLQPNGFPEPPTAGGGPPPLSDAIYSGTIDVPGTTTWPSDSDEILVDINYSIDPGDYALVFGAGGKFGSSVTTSSFAPHQEQDLIGSPTLFYWVSGNNSWELLQFNTRFLLEAVPEPATLLLLTLAGLPLLRRRRR